MTLDTIYARLDVIRGYGDGMKENALVTHDAMVVVVVLYYVAARNCRMAKKSLCVCEATYWEDMKVRCCCCWWLVRFG